MGVFWLAVLPVAVSVLGSLFSRRSQQSRALSLLRVSLVVPFVTLILFLGAPRMRVPFDPVILVLAVLRLVPVRHSLPRRRASHLDADVSRR